MADLTTILTQFAILFLIIAVGFIAAKCGVFPKGTNKMLAQLVLCITNPCMVLYSVLGGERMLSNMQVLLLTGIAFASYGVVIALAQFLPKLLHCEKRDVGLYRFMIVFSNTSFLGFPVIAAIFGSNAVFYAAIFNLVFQLVLYTYGVAQLGSSDGRMHFSPKLLLTPMIISSLLAYIFYLTDFKTPAIITDTLGMLRNVTSPVCMLVIGIALAQVPMKSVFTNWRLYALTAIKQLVLPICAFFLLHTFVTNQLILGVTVVMVGMPIAVSSTLMTAKYGGNEKLAASGVFLSTLLSLGTIPFLMWLLF